MTINTGKFEIEILKKLNASTNTSDIQALVNAKEFLKSSDIVVVANYSDLPAVTSVPAGSLYFVEADELLYVPAQDFFGEVAWRALYDREYSNVWSWGVYPGDGTTVAKCSPVSIVGGFNDIWKISKGQCHAAFIRTNGTLWSWGQDTTGQGRLGDGTTVDKSSPVSVVGGFTDWCQVVASDSNSAGVRTNGTIWAWGYNNCGGLGDGTTVRKCSPVSVVGGFTDWCQVSISSQVSAGVRTNGTIWTWGKNLCGSLGNNSTVARSSPGSIVGGFTDWCQVSVAGATAIGLRTNGTIWTWGCAVNGVLGNNSTVSRSSPVSVVGGFTDWCQISTSGRNMAAIRTNGTLWTWGYNICGSLGDGTTVAKSSPVSVIGGFTDWCQVSPATGLMAGLRTNGSIWSWGCNGSGRIGDGTVAAKCSPVSVVGGFTDWCQVSTGFLGTSAIRRKVF